MFNDTFTPKTHNTFVLNANDARKAFWREFDSNNHHSLLSFFILYADGYHALCHEHYMKYPENTEGEDSLFMDDFRFIKRDYEQAYSEINTRVMRS
jgi:regulator of replication initiation timing